VFKAKLKFKDKLEQEFGNMNTKQAFRRVKTLTGYQPKSNPCAITDTVSFAKELNTFDTRFDTQDFSA